MTRFPSLAQAEDWFNSFLNFERDPKKGIFWLETVRFLCALTGNPQKSFRSIHVAGSKGKGSVCAMLAHILDKAGFAPAGLYLSPHVADFAERFTLCGKFFPDSAYSLAFTELKTAVEKIPLCEFPESRKPTWFELVTVFAFLLFRNAACRVAVFETGMGGRLDATNVLEPELCIINTIEKEHTEYLGDTLEKIAEEKGGIIKDGVPLVIAQQEPCVRSVLERIALEKKAPFYVPEDYVSEIASVTDAHGTKAHITSRFFSRALECRLGLCGEIQAQNAALAAVSAKLFFAKTGNGSIEESNIEESIIEQALGDTTLPARFEIHAQSEKSGKKLPFFVLDGAHTPRSIAGTVKTFCAVCKNTAHGASQNAVLLFACAADKDVESISRIFAHKKSIENSIENRCRFTKIFLTRPGSAKQADTERIQKAFAACAFSDIAYMYDFTDAIKNAFEYAVAHNMPLLVTGSFYLAAEVGAWMST